MFKTKFSILFSIGNAYILMCGYIIVSVTFFCFSRLLSSYPLIQILAEKDTLHELSFLWEPGYSAEVTWIMYA